MSHSASVTFFALDREYETEKERHTLDTQDNPAGSWLKDAISLSLSLSHFHFLFSLSLHRGSGRREEESESEVFASRRSSSEGAKERSQIQLGDWQQISLVIVRTESSGKQQRPYVNPRQCD